MVFVLFLNIIGNYIKNESKFLELLCFFLNTHFLNLTKIKIINLIVFLG